MNLLELLNKNIVLVVLLRKEVIEAVLVERLPFAVGELLLRGSGSWAAARRDTVKAAAGTDRGRWREANAGTRRSHAASARRGVRRRRA